MAQSERVRRGLRVFRARLAHHLALVGWNQSRFAEELGVSAPFVSQWLSGSRTPKLTQLLEIAAALNVTIVELFLPLP